MRRKFVLTGLATVGVATAGMLTGVTPVSASTGGVHHRGLPDPRNPAGWRTL